MMRQVADMLMIHQILLCLCLHISVVLCAADGSRQSQANQQGLITEKVFIPPKPSSILSLSNEAFVSGEPTNAVQNRNTFKREDLLKSAGSNSFRGNSEVDLRDKKLARANLNQMVQFDADTQEPQQHEAPTLSSEQHECSSQEKMSSAGLCRPANEMSGGPADQSSELEKFQTNRYSEGDAPVDGKLDRNFLSLFDKLWRLKNSTFGTLVRLEYFGQNMSVDSARDKLVVADQNSPKGCASELGGCKNPQTDETRPQGDSKGSARGPQQQERPNKAGSSGSQQHVGSATFLLRKPWLFQQHATISKTGASPAADQKLAQAGARLSGWLTALQLRARQAAEKLCSSIRQLLAGQQQNRRRQFAEGSAKRAQDNSQSGSSNPVVGLLEPTGSDGADSPSASESALSATKTRARRATELNNEQSAAKLVNPYLMTTSSAPGGAGTENCYNLTIDEREKCRTTEASINEHLNHSFPGTLEAIEGNCKQITLLLSQCWPQQLLQLRQSLLTWNETLIQNSEYPLARLGPVDATNQLSCGSGEPEETQMIRDRSSWMWLNLCTDKKFRIDYVLNLRCLALWSQERAQQICSQEYRQMQGYLTHQSEINAATAEAHANRLLGPQLNQVSSWKSSRFATRPVWQRAPSEGGGLDVRGGAAAKFNPEQLEGREVSSKMLCCMFDQLLRCVHKQAVRDCGRVGAQFVVNFISRIGTDDMKYLCNGETRHVAATQIFTTAPAATATTSRTLRNGSLAQQQPFVGSLLLTNVGLPSGRLTTSSSRRGHHHDRNPFIDVNYCTDPRIQSALQNVSAFYGDHTKGRVQVGASPVHNPASSRQSIAMEERLRQPVNYDPTYFGNDVATSGSGFNDQRDGTPTPNRTWILITLLLAYNLYNRFM